MPELPEMRGLAERLSAELAGRQLERIDVLSFAGLKTAVPSHESLLSDRVGDVTSRGKFLVIGFESAVRLLVHLGQSGRVHLEHPALSARPRDGVVRLVFADDTGLLVRELSRERRAGWWVVAPGDDGPLGRLGPDPFSEETAEVVRTSGARRQLHSWLRDQQIVAGIGRGYVDDILHHAGLSPFANVSKLDSDQRERLVNGIVSVLSTALERERQRVGALSGNDLGDRFVVHRRSGQPCPSCTTGLRRVSFPSCEVVYCPHCQSNDSILADRRMSRLLR